MYAVIRAGGKQYKVTEGDVIEVERISDGKETVEFTPLLVVDDKGHANSDRSELAKATVTAKVLGAAAGPKVDIFKYRNKSRNRRHTGHRQKYTTLQIAGINIGGAATKAPAETQTEAPATAKKTTAKKTTAKKTTAKKTTAKKTTAKRTASKASEKKED